MEAVDQCPDRARLHEGSDHVARGGEASAVSVRCRHLARAGLVARHDSRRTVARDDRRRLGLVVVDDLVLLRTAAVRGSSGVPRWRARVACKGGALGRRAKVTLLSVAC